MNTDQKNIYRIYFEEFKQIGSYNYNIEEFLKKIQNYLQDNMFQLIDAIDITKNLKILLCDWRENGVDFSEQFSSQYKDSQTSFSMSKIENSHISLRKRSTKESVSSFQSNFDEYQLKPIIKQKQIFATNEKTVPVFQTFNDQRRNKTQNLQKKDPRKAQYSQIIYKPQKKLSSSVQKNCRNKNKIYTQFQNLYEETPKFLSIDKVLEENVNKIKNYNIFEHSEGSCLSQEDQEIDNYYIDFLMETNDKKNTTTFSKSKTKSISQLDSLSDYRTQYQHQTTKGTQSKKLKNTNIHDVIVNPLEKDNIGQYKQRQSMQSSLFKRKRNNPLHLEKKNLETKSFFQIFGKTEKKTTKNQQLHQIQESYSRKSNNQ